MKELLISNAPLISQVAIALGVFIAVRSTMRMRKASGKICPVCSEPLPASRLPTDLYELVAGGWTCAKCKTKLSHDLRKR
jgi:hypothetical protein